MKRWLLIGIVVVIVAVGLFWWRSASSKDSQSGDFRFGKVDRGTVQTVVSATGTVQAVTTVLVGSQVSGTIKDIFVDFNSPVHKGEIIARLDPTFLQAAVTENEASVERAKASLTQSQRDLERAADLYNKSLIAKADYDNAMTAVDLAKAGVQQAQAQLDRAKVNLSYSVIKAPIDGVVISRDVDVGQTVAASLQAPTLFTIAQDLTEMQIQTAIDEADIGGLREGMDAMFTVDAFPELEFAARIRQIRYAATEDQGVVTYPVILTVSNPDLKLRPGMTANVTVITAKREDVLRLPATALRFRPPESAVVELAQNQKGQQAGDSTASEKRHWNRVGSEHASGWADSTRARGGSSRATVYTEDASGKLVPHHIKTGLNDGSYVEVVSGELSEGDSVAVGLKALSLSNSGNIPPGLGPTHMGGRR